MQDQTKEESFDDHTSSEKEEWKDNFQTGGDRGEEDDGDGGVNAIMIGNYIQHHSRDVF